MNDIIRKRVCLSDNSELERPDFQSQKEVKELFLPPRNTCLPHTKLSQRLQLTPEKKSRVIWDPTCFEQAVPIGTYWKTSL